MVEGGTGCRYVAVQCSTVWHLTEVLNEAFDWHHPPEKSTTCAVSPTRKEDLSLMIRGLRKLTVKAPQVVLFLEVATSLWLMGPSHWEQLVPTYTCARFPNVTLLCKVQRSPHKGSLYQPPLSWAGRSWS